MQFRELFMKLMRDEVYSVRDETLNALKKIAVSLDKPWMESNLLAILEPFLQEKNHFLRMNFFSGFQKMAKNLPLDLQKKIIGKIKDSYKDPLPNVRIMAIEALRSLTAQLKDKSARVAHLLDPGRHYWMDRGQAEV